MLLFTKLSLNWVFMVYSVAGSQWIQANDLDLCDEVRRHIEIMCYNSYECPHYKTTECIKIGVK